MPVRGLVNGHLGIDSVIFATDFSPASHPASLYATVLAAHFRTVLTVVHVFLPSQNAKEAETRDGIASKQRTLVQELLDLTTNALTPKAGEGRSLLLEGDPSVVIPGLANESCHSILLLGTHSGTSLESRLLGSVAEGILRQSAIPTLTVGQHVHATRDAFPFQRVLYVTDSSPVAAQAAPLACAFASSFSSRLEVVSVIDENEGAVARTITEFDFHTQQEPSANLLERCAHFETPRSVRYSKHAHEEILGRLKQDKFDLLVLGIEQKSSLGFITRNSGAFRIIAESPCPVLTITDAATRPAEILPG